MLVMKGGTTMRCYNRMQDRAGGSNGRRLLSISGRLKIVAAVAVALLAVGVVAASGALNTHNTATGTELASAASKPNVTYKKCSAEHKLKSKPNGNTTTVTFQNNSASTVKIYWLDLTGQRVYYKSLAAGEGYQQGTYKSHVWVVTDSGDTCLSIWVATKKPGTVTIT